MAIRRALRFAGTGHHRAHPASRITRILYSVLLRLFYRCLKHGYRLWLFARDYHSGYQHERVYSLWRRWPDLVLFVLHFFGAQVPGASALLRISLCLPQFYSGSLKTYAPEVRLDPYLNDYPCNPLKQDIKAQPLFLSYSKLAKRISPPEAIEWLNERWWWAVPYASVRYGFMYLGTFYVIFPAMLLLPLLAPRWWYGSGRTACMAAWRISAAGLPLFGVLFLGDGSKYLLWDFIEPPCQMFMLSVIKRGFIGMVPWSCHWRVVLLESSLMVFSWFVKLQFSPPSLFHVRKVVLATGLGCVISLLLNIMEYHIRPYICHVRSFMVGCWVGLKGCVHAAVYKLYEWMTSLRVLVAAFYVTLLILWHVWIVAVWPALTSELWPYGAVEATDVTVLNACLSA